ncbi:hypothetical protein AB9P05_18565 [Roseivirga sp. BDSF3-8]|uniref:hypothetical protein n=1 Tax=Roseivirga sp. BDSF3-8 TaxID=3241598 RepID=UPI00353183D7
METTKTHTSFYYILALGLFTLVFSACRNTETGTNIPEATIETTLDTEDMEAPDLGEKVPPATARIMGEVVNILLPEEASDLNHTYCDSLPCRAEIRVVSLIGLGDGFDAQLDMDDTITVYFPTPALSTEELIMEGSSDLREYTTSGLHTGDLFRADLQVNDDASSLDDSPFVVGRLVRSGK